MNQPKSPESTKSVISPAPRSEIDGTASDPLWQRANLLDDFSFPWKEEVAPRTEFRTLCDEQVPVPRLHGRRPRPRPGRRFQGQDGRDQGGSGRDLLRPRLAAGRLLLSGDRPARPGAGLRGHLPRPVRPQLDVYRPSHGGVGRTATRSRPRFPALSDDRGGRAAVAGCRGRASWRASSEPNSATAPAAKPSKTG